MRVRVGGKLLVGLLAATGLAAVSPANALARPRVVLSLPGSADAASPISFSFSAHGLPAHSGLVIQRQEGAAHVWRTKVRLRARSGAATLTGLPIGVYSIRIAAIAAHGKVVAQQRHGLKVFGQVPFSTLFGGSGGVYTSPTTTFPYVLKYYDGAVDFTALTVTTNPCRSVHLVFDSAPPSDGEDLSKQHGTVTLVQQSADPVTVTAAGQQVGTLDTNVVPGQSWGLNLAQVERNGGFLFTWFLDGSAVCDSTHLDAR